VNLTVGRERGSYAELLGCEPETRHGRSRERVRKQVHSKASLRRAVNAVQRCGVACVRTDHQGLEKRHARKQPANLAVEGAEESLSTLTGYTPTVRPPPKRS
jgi:hypothetical protein